MKSLLLIFSLSFLSSVAVANPLEDSRYENAKPPHVIRFDKQTDVKSSESIRDAIVLGNFRKVKKLINKKNVDINAVDKEGRTALHLAVAFSRMDVVELLVEKGAIKEKRNYLGWTPLHVAVAFEEVDIARFLLEKGVNTEKRNNIGWTPLHAAVGDKNIDMIKLFIEKGAPMDVVTGTGITPLQLARELKPILGKKMDLIIELLTKKEKAKATKVKANKGAPIDACKGEFSKN